MARKSIQYHFPADFTTGRETATTPGTIAVDIIVWRTRVRYDLARTPFVFFVRFILLCVVGTDRPKFKRAPNMTKTKSTAVSKIKYVHNPRSIGPVSSQFKVHRAAVGSTRFEPLRLDNFSSSSLFKWFEGAPKVPSIRAREHSTFGVHRFLKRLNLALFEYIYFGAF